MIQKYIIIISRIYAGLLWRALCISGMQCRKSAIDYGEKYMNIETKNERRNEELNLIFVWLL